MLLTCIPLALASCKGDVHENEPGGLSIALAWQDETDDTAVKDIRVWIFNAADGKLVREQQYTDTRALASERYQLGAGQYKVIAAVNLSSPFSANSPASMDGLLLSLTDASSSPAHAFYGVADATVKSANDVTVITESLQRIMSEMTITINNAPPSSVLTGTVNKAATGFCPCRQQTNGDSATVTIPSTTAQGSTIQTQTMRLMPTAYNESQTSLSLQITDAGGHVSYFNIDAPVMNAGGKYEVTLDYNYMRAYMNLSSCTINSWTEGWTYSDEILNPNK